MSLTRREFLGVAAGVTAAGALAPGLRLIDLVQARSPEEAVTAINRWGLLIDTGKCNDCDVCVTACSSENGWKLPERPETDPQWIRKVTLKDKQTGYVQTLPMLCQHCEKPPCVDVCPTGASFKRADGIVLVDKHICIGCRYCMMACPYKARSFVHEDVTDQKHHAPRGKGTVESCTLCVHRVDAGRIPACVEACNKDGNKAMVFGDLNDGASDIRKALADGPSAQLRPDLELNTGVRYRGLS
ncbi:4Fe-4S ferredoxin [Sulfurifustis variabilis]|uniref:4Fe-4S ferredoxin n=1 Tax=Sulfurifustis variabilis TaxID=1675686 RepID=A0A1B4VDP9_9GAMM|nr:4Fe-4S dicluster domain-containing protein [Sulfurifustis variabilis]BAU48517.1 4Fe-4S ferredoxin [Sulfurifustis variabilis]